MGLMNGPGPDHVHFGDAALVGGVGVIPQFARGSYLRFRAGDVIYAKNMRKDPALAWAAGAVVDIEVLGGDSALTATRLVALGLVGLAVPRSRTLIRVVAHDGDEALFEVRVSDDKVRVWLARIGWVRQLLDRPAAVATPSKALSEQLRELTELHVAGALSDDEFAAAKAQLLGL